MTQTLLSNIFERYADNAYNIFVIKTFIFASGFLFLFLRKRKVTFLYLFLAFFLYFLIYIIYPNVICRKSVSILAVLFAGVFFLSLRELLEHERKGVSLAEFVSLNKLDCVFIAILFISWFFLKVFLFQ